MYLEIRHRDAVEERILVRAVQDFLIGGEVATFEWAVGVQLPWPSDLHAPDLFHFRIQFLDARGIRWERVNRDQPKRVSEPDGPAKDDVRRLPHRLNRTPERRGSEPAPWSSTPT